VVAPILNAYFGSRSSVDPCADGVLATPTNMVLILSNVKSRLVFGKLVKSSEPTCGDAFNDVPSSIVPSLRPKTLVNIPLNVDASSGVNDSRVCAVILALLVGTLTISTCPTTAQPAGGL